MDIIWPKLFVEGNLHGRALVMKLKMLTLKILKKSSPHQIQKDFWK